MIVHVELVNSKIPNSFGEPIKSFSTGRLGVHLFGWTDDYLSRIKSSSTSIFSAVLEGWSDEKAMRCLGVSIQISRVFWANAMIYF
jgi:hypothetical protein